MKTSIRLTMTIIGIQLLTQAALGMASSKVIIPQTPGSTDQPSTSPAPSTPTTTRSTIPLWEAAHSQGRTWTDHVYKELDTLGTSLLQTVPADASTFCPNYKNLSHANRKSYWTFLLSAMTRYESNFKPETQYTEDFNDSKGNRVVSRGLLQLSIESGNAYGCGFASATDVHDAKKNLSCGIRILNRWMSKDKRIAGKVNDSWQGGARYWSVLRTTNKTAYSNIVKWSKELSICGI